MLNVCIIGVGNAGNQIAELGKKEYNIPGIAINSSSKDIATLTKVDKIVVGDQLGAGKDRATAKEFIQRHFQNLMKNEALNVMIKEANVIFVISSTGGGTGSGMCPVLTTLLSKFHPGKKFIPVGILPPVKESVAAQQNTIEYFKEMQMMHPTFMSYDNNQYSKLNTKTMMENVNRQIVEDICVIRGDHQLSTTFNSIDEKDMLRILDAPGRLVITKALDFKEKDLDDNSIEDRLIKFLSNSGVTELQRDGVVRKLGVITNLSERIQDKLDVNLPELKEVIGEPVEGFEHISYNTSKEAENRVLVVMSGLSIPDDRLMIIMERIEEATAKITTVATSSVLDSFDLCAVTSLRSTHDEDEEEEQATSEIDVNDIFSMFK